MTPLNGVIQHVKNWLPANVIFSDPLKTICFSPSPMVLLGKLAFHCLPLSFQDKMSLYLKNYRIKNSREKSWKDMSLSNYQLFKNSHNLNYPATYRKADHAEFVSTLKFVSVLWPAYLVCLSTSLHISLVLSSSPEAWWYFLVIGSIFFVSIALKINHFFVWTICNLSWVIFFVKWPARNEYTIVTLCFFLHANCVFFFFLRGIFLQFLALSVMYLACRSLIS